MAEDVCAEVTGNVWQILVSAGEAVEAGEEIIVLESMKMEVPIISSIAGTVSSVLVKVGDAVVEGDVLIVLE